ncbi:PGPGW domain-containing protein [Novipirellula sp.]|uniref:PGPGW domain-containing protein n=1 Tax=Novipirellula sp. TaxID=2795430 RepID=UPI0035629F22
MLNLYGMITEPMFWWVATVSAIVFAASIVAVPWLILRLPSDYFNHRRRIMIRPQTRASVYYHCVWIVLKNIAGAAFLTMGIAMLVLPGQGLLTIFIGLSMLDFPGKYQLQRALVSRPFILKPLNWIRRKGGKTDFIVQAS